MIDTHSHIYLEEFDADRTDVVQRAKAAGVEKIVLPNIDENTLSALIMLEQSEPNYFYAAIGLHPTSVNADWAKQLQFVKNQLQKQKFIAVGEIGLDFYWDKTFAVEQTAAFEQQILLALKYDLPIIVHSRDSFDACFYIVNKYDTLTGVFHSFGGTAEQAQKIISLGGRFKIGVNGVVTFKNSGLGDVLKNIPLEYIVLETDAPYLTPVPFRGKRNESAYLTFILQKLAEIYETSESEIEKKTVENTLKLFKNII
ncbi:MAG: TatD family hydrolase [Paludibacter sp.]|jgi:TatD DNase family protein|nr:TatD family hydrolase [Paludibacter sp.]